jgi:hypothetical protein
VLVGPAPGVSRGPPPDTLTASAGIRLRADGTRSGMRLFPHFSSGVDLNRVSSADVLSIVTELVRVSDSMESIPTNGALWASFHAQHPMMMRVSGWLIQYVVDQKHERLVVVNVSRG